MDFFLSRYRNITVLLVVIVAQLMLIAYQVKSNKDIPLMRVWAVTTVTPVEQVLEVVRSHTWGFVEDYFVLLGVKGENDKLKHENGQLKLENQYLKSELNTADRAQTLSVFQAHSQSKTVAARIIGNGTGANSKVVFVDRGSASGVESGMAVVTPDGIVGKVVDAYPTAALIMLITDPTFAAGVVSQKNHVRGTLKGQGHSECLVDYVQNEERVDPGEMFFTSGDDRIFPRGFPVGQVSAVRNGKTFKEIYITPSGMQGGPEEVLIVLQGVHEEIPDGEIASPGYKILQPPADTEAAGADPSAGALVTDADRLKEQYKQAGQAQNHVFGEGVPGSKPPDFTKIPGIRAAAGDAASGGSARPAAPAAAATQNPAQPASTSQNRTSQNPGGGNNPPAPSAGAPAKAVSSKASQTADAPKPKPRLSAPILVTDPTDADPDSATAASPANNVKPPAPAQTPPQAAPKPAAPRPQTQTNP
ncbi:MAG TPA: rod shape-determining protein MreC [Bryobacteraceae bacterium]|nr:rod shape-determining protein MreC [Bryobacteraceae bacterium]